MQKTMLMRRRKKIRNVCILCIFIVFVVRLSLLHSRQSWQIRDEASEDNQRSSPDMHLTISVVTYNRLPSLQRLLLSLSRARFSRGVDLCVHVEAGAPMDLLEFVDKFEWSHGKKFVYVRVIQAGLIPAVVESWYPANDQSFGLILEDDVEISPFFHDWLTHSLGVVQRSNMRHRIFGISMYTPRVIETLNPSKLFLPDVKYPNSDVFLQQLPCSWGAMYFPRTWRLFVRYLRHRITTNGSLIVPHSRTNGWVGSWKKYYIELAWAEGLFMVYPNFQNQTSFSTNNVEQGTHVAAADWLHRSEIYKVPLHDSLARLRINTLNEIPILDVHGNPYARQNRNNMNEFCRRISSGHTGRQHGSPASTTIPIGNKLVNGYILPQGYTLVSVPKNGIFFKGWVTRNGFFIIERCLVADEHMCSEIARIGKESSLPDLSLFISDAGRLTIASYLCLGTYCGTKVVWQSAAVKACAAHVLYLQDNGLLSLHCGCGCTDRQPVWVSGRGSSQVVRCSAEQEDQNILLPHKNLSSSLLNTMLSDKGRDGRYLEAVMQADGNFVLYLNPSPSIHPVFSIPTTMQADIYTFQIAVDGNLHISGEVQGRSFMLWDNGFHGSQTLPYFLRIDPCGALAVFEGYGACEFGNLVWTGGIGNACPRSHPHCLDPVRAQRQLMCEQVTPDIYNFLASKSSFTVLLYSYGDSLTALEESIDHLSQHHRISCILVVNLLPYEQGMGSFFLNGKLVKCLHTVTDSPNNKFFPSVHITTEAVLVLDGHTFLHHDDLELMFRSWERHKSKLVGFYSKSIPLENCGNVSIILTNAVMLHKSTLHKYACLSGQGIHRVVDRYGRCEDVALNLFASQSSTEPHIFQVQPLRTGEPVRPVSQEQWSSPLPEMSCLKLIKEMLKPALAGIETIHGCQDTQK